MKFVALALALLLAVGSQAASLQADAPTSVEHYMGVVDAYFTQVKQQLLDALDGSEYEQYKTTVAQRLDTLQTQVKAWQGPLSQQAGGVYGQLADVTASFRASIMTDITAMEAELAPKRAELRAVIKKHIDEYRTKMVEFANNNRDKIDAVRTAMESFMEDLKTRVSQNAEETKAAALPIVEQLRTKIAEYAESMKAMVAPHVEEYREKLSQAYRQGTSLNADQLTALNEEMQRSVEGIKTNVQHMVEAVVAAFNRN